MFEAYRRKIIKGNADFPEEYITPEEKIWLVYQWKIKKEIYRKYIIVDKKEYDGFIIDVKNNISDMEITDSGAFELKGGKWDVPSAIKSTIGSEDIIFMKKEDCIEIMSPEDYEEYQKFVNKIVEKIRMTIGHRSCIIWEK